MFTQGDRGHLTAFRGLFVNLRELCLCSSAFFWAAGLWLFRFAEGFDLDGKNSCGIFSYILCHRGHFKDVDLLSNLSPLQPALLTAVRRPADVSEQRFILKNQSHLPKLLNKKAHYFFFFLTA